MGLEFSKPALGYCALAFCTACADLSSIDATGGGCPPLPHGLSFQFQEIIEDFRNVAIAHAGIHGGLEVC